MSCNAKKPGFHVVKVGSIALELPIKYEQVSLIGHGAFGNVYKAYDQTEDKYRAIKKLKSVFSTSMHAKRACRELMIMKHMKHENVIELLDFFTPNTSYDSFDDIYLTMPLMDSDLDNVLRTQQLNLEQICFILYQLLRAIKYIHSAGIIHRDIKPSNIGLMENCEVKIMDFGLARKVNLGLQTGYVATRWYRAPEIILNWMQPNHTVDIWSIGCIFGEMLVGHVIFPGKSHTHQLLKILKFLGTPSAEFVDKLTSLEARKFMMKQKFYPRVDFKEYFSQASDEGSLPSLPAVDLLEKMFQFDVDVRITPEEAISHPFLAEFHEPGDEPVTCKFESTFDIDQSKSTEYYKKRLYELITQAH